MNPFSVVVVYVLIWWLLFFMALPIGVNRAGTDQNVGSPNRPMLLRKAIIVSVITAVITFVAWLSVSQGWLNLRPMLDRSF